MSQLEQNKQVVRQYVAAFNAGDLPAVRRLFSSDATVQGVLGQAPVDEAVPIWKQLHDALAIHLEIEELVAEGQAVAARYTETGVFRGEFRGQAPTGKSFKLVAMEFFSIRDGQITLRWGARDSAAMARQTGMAL